MIAGQSVDLECQIGAGNPPPSVSWFLDEKPISEANISGRGEMLRQRQILRIKGISSDEEPQQQKSPGSDELLRYRCELENNVGRVSREFLVYTISPPRLGPIIDKQPIEVFEGNSVTFDCPLLYVSSTKQLQKIIN